MAKFSLEKLSGKYSYEFGGEIHHRYSLCANEEIATCEANNKKEAIEILNIHSPVALDKNGYAQDDLFSYCVCEIL